MMRELLPNRKHAPAQLGDVLIIGYGVTGHAAFGYLLPLLGGRIGSITLVCGKGSHAEDAKKAACSLGEDAAGNVIVLEDCEDIPSKYDLCIASPGIPETSEFYGNAKASSKELISEIELAWRESPEDSIWVAITGTNGKTTTTALTEHLLCAAGFDAESVGNIGQSAIESVSASLAKVDGAPEGSVPKPRVFVAETSSFQLASIKDFAPDAAILLGITPDHVLWHGSEENYAESKFNVLRNLSRSNGVAIMDATNDVVRAKVREIKAFGDDRGYPYVPLGTKAGIEGDMRAACGALNAAFESAEGDLIVATEGVERNLGPASGLQIKGEHNVVNALAAASCAVEVGADPAKVREALATFAPLEHRIEPAGEIDGVAFVNDSKATNTDAAIKAVEAFEPGTVIGMFGGRDKMGPLDGLVEASRGSLKAAICYGEGGPRFTEAFGPLADDGTKVVCVRTFDDAFDAACDMAEPGDTVLLSPACASFDEFSSFEERGEVFKEKVRSRAGKTLEG